MAMFEGYSSETVDFLWGIRLNNNREWFLEHKNDYVEKLYEPTKALGKDIFEKIASKKTGTLVKVSRIYRDARMHHPVPYKESLWICVRQDVQWWGENPCLYFEINPEGVHYGFFFWKPSVAVLNDIRADIAANPKEFLKLIKKVEKATGLKIEAECYKRPKPCDDPAIAPYFAWKEQIGCVVREDFSEQTFGPQLGERVIALMKNLMPLYDYFTKFCNRE